MSVFQICKSFFDRFVCDGRDPQSADWFMAVCLVKNPAGYQFSFTSGVCSNDDIFDVFSVKLCFYCIVLFTGLSDHHQFHFIRHHRKGGHFPFGIFSVIFFRICQCDQMSQCPGHHIFFSFQCSIAFLVTVKYPGNVSGNGRFLCYY